jgi:hypothetical protein
MKNCIYVCLAFLIISCTFKQPDNISGNGRVITKVLTTDTIRRVIISDRLDAVLIPSDSVYIILNADENLHDYVSAEITESTIKISCEKKIRMARAKEIRIYSRYLRRADISSHSTFETRDSLLTEEFSLDATSGAEVKIMGRFDRLIANASSGSNVHLAGYTEYLNATISSAADLFAYDLTAKTADVVSSSAADARVNVTDEAKFNASSAADIIYRGDPKVIDSRASSLGDIKKSRY